MKRVIIESPYAGAVERNLTYAREALQHSLLRGEAPMASHLLYTQVLEDDLEHERLMGIQAGYEWLSGADLVAFYVDLGWSHGMLQALRVARIFQRPVEVRSLTGTKSAPPLDVAKLLEYAAASGLTTIYWGDN